MNSPVSLILILCWLALVYGYIIPQKSSVQSDLKHLLFYTSASSVVVIKLMLMPANGYDTYSGFYWVLKGLFKSGKLPFCSLLCWEHVLKDRGCFRVCVYFFLFGDLDSETKESQAPRAQEAGRHPKKALGAAVGFRWGTYFENGNAQSVESASLMLYKIETFYIAILCQWKNFIKAVC